MSASWHLRLAAMLFATGAQDSPHGGIQPRADSTSIVSIWRKQMFPGLGLPDPRGRVPGQEGYGLVAKSEAGQDSVAGFEAQLRLGFV